MVKRRRWGTGTLQVLLLGMVVLLGGVRAAVVQGEGQAALFGHEPSVARAEALQNAQREALKRGLQEELSKRGDWTDTDSIQGWLDQDTQGFITHQTLLEDRQDNDTYRVRIQVEVKLPEAVAQLESLGLVLRNLRNPRVLVWISTDAGVNVPSALVNTTRELLETYFTQKHFKVLDAEQTQILLARQGKDLKDVALAARAQADFLIRARIRSEDLGKTGVMTAAQFDLTLDSLSTGTGQLLISQHTSASERDINAALAAKAALKTALSALQAPFLRDTIAAFNTRSKTSNHTLLLTVRGVPDFAAHRKLKAALQKLKGVTEGALQDRYNLGVSEFDVQGDVSTDDLADALSALKDVPVDITSLSGDALEGVIRKP